MRNAVRACPGAPCARRRNAESLERPVNLRTMRLHTEGSPLEDASPELGNTEDRCFACFSTRVEHVSGFRDHHTLLERQYALVVCAGCGSARLAETLSPQEQAAVYPPTFYSYVPSADRHPLLAVLDKLRYDRHRFRPRFKSLLEVGSGCGEFLATIKNRGKVVGLERSTAARQVASGLGIDVRVGDVTDARIFGEAAFDYIYLSHSFEHLDDPAAALASMRRWLDANGKLFVAVPNYAGALPRLFPKAWYNLALPLHVSQFTPSGITMLLERNGFTVDKIRYNSDPFSIPMSVFFARSGNVASLNAYVKAIVFASALALIPVSRLLDFLRRGDCMEVYAHKS
jgi:SAM-dependent methyltransferase